MKKAKYPDLATCLSQLVRAGCPEFPSIYVVEDSFEHHALHTALMQLIPQLVEIPLDRLIEEISSFSLFSDKKYLCSFTSDDTTSKLHEALSLRSQALFLTSKKIEIENEASLSGLYVEIPGPKPWDRPKRLASFLVYYFGQKQKKIERDALLLLSESLLSADEAIISECEKLLLYVGDVPQITKNDVLAICTLKATGTLFNLWNAMTDGNEVELLSKLDMVIDDDTHPMQIVRFLRTQWGGFLRFAEDPEGESVPPFKQEPYRKLLHRYSLKDAQAIFSRIDDLEFQMKNSEGDPKLLLELFLQRLCSSYCLQC